MIVPLTRREAASKLRAKWGPVGEGGVSLGLADIDFKLPDEFKRRLKELIDEECFHYAEPRGDPELLRAIVEKVRSINCVDVTERNVLLTVGATNAIWLATHCLLRRGDRVVVVEPTYPPLFQAAVDAGARVTFLHLSEERGFHLPPEELDRLQGLDFRMLVVCNPNNPTGTVFTRSELEALVEAAAKKGALILADELYEAVTYEREHVSVASLPGAQDITVTISGFTKAHGLSGFRVGYVVAGEDIIKKMESVNRTIVMQPGTLDQKAALLALTLPEFKRWLRELREYLRVNRDLACSELRRVPWVTCVRPEGAFFAFPNVSWVCDDIAFSRELLRRKRVLVLPGSGFGPSGKGHLRLNFATSRENLRDALRAIVDLAYELVY